MNQDTTQDTESILIQDPEADLNIYAYRLNDESADVDYSIRLLSHRTRTGLGIGAEAILLTQAQMDGLISGLQEINDDTDD